MTDHPLRAAEVPTVEEQRIDADARRHALLDAGCTTYLLRWSRHHIQVSILCLCCGQRSWHPTDVTEKYCSFCHAWHEP